MRIRSFGVLGKGEYNRLRMANEIIFKYLGYTSLSIDMLTEYYESMHGGDKK